MWNTKKRPPVSEEALTNLQENNTANVVTGIEQAPDYFVRATKKTGIDFEYDGHEMRIFCRYEKYIYQVIQNQETRRFEPNKCPSEHLFQLIGRQLWRFLCESLFFKSFLPALGQDVSAGCQSTSTYEKALSPRHQTSTATCTIKAGYMFIHEDVVFKVTKVPSASLQNSPLVVKCTRVLSKTSNKYQKGNSYEFTDWDLVQELTQKYITKYLS